MGSAKRDLYAKPTASREAAQLWVGRNARHGSPEGNLCHWLSAGCVSPASRNCFWCISVPTAAPLRGLQWVSHRGVPSAHPVRVDKNY